jgi:hypothetical protein
LNDPKKPKPGLAVGIFNSHVQNKYCGADVKQNTVKSILLADFQQKVFFKKG